MRPKIMLLLLAFLAACSNAKPPAPRGKTQRVHRAPSRAERFCKAPCDQVKRCKPSDKLLIRQACEGNDRCMNSGQAEAVIKFMRRDVYDELIKCFDTTCTREDQCFGTALIKLGVDPERDPLTQNCKTKQSACASAGFSVTDAQCSAGVFLNDDGKVAFDRCLQLACIDIGGCLSALFPSHL